MADERDDSTEDSHERFLNDTAAKFEKADRERASGEEGADDADAAGANAEGEEGEDAGAAGDEDDDSAPEHTESDTSDETRDGGTSESEDDSGEEGEEEHPEGDKPDDSDKAADADAEADASGEEGETEGEEEVEGDEAEGAVEEEDDISDETKNALAARGADLTLEDVPEKYRGLVATKLRSMDVAFTRTQQEQTAFRKERAEFLADRKYREENPEFVVVELLRKDPTLFEKVNDRLTKIEDPDVAKAFEIVQREERKKATDAVSADVERAERIMSRADAVEAASKKEAARLGLPWRLAERAVENALLRKAEDKRDVSDDEIRTILAEEAKAYRTETRTNRRDDSREQARNRAAVRKTVKPTSRPPAGAASPRPSAPKKPAVDQNNEESRLAAMERSAARIKPGAKARG